MPGFVEGIFEKGIERWQLDIVIRALKDEYLYSLQNISSFASELGINRKQMTEMLESGDYPPPGPLHARRIGTLLIVTNYLVEIGRLSEDHLIAEDLSHLAPSALTSFFNPDWDGESHIDPSFTGSFIEWHKRKNSEQHVSTLLINPASDRGYYKIKETVTKVKYIARENDYLFNKENSFGSIYLGWGIIIPNGGLLIMLKSKTTDDQKIYINNFSQTRKKGSNKVSELIVIKTSDLLLVPENYISEDNEKLILNMHNDYIKFVSEKDFSCSEIDPHDITDNSGESIEDRVLESFKDDSRFSHPSLANNVEKGKILMDEDSKNKLGDQLIRSVLNCKRLV